MFLVTIVPVVHDDVLTTDPEPRPDHEAGVGQHVLVGLVVPGPSKPPSSLRPPTWSQALGGV